MSHFCALQRNASSGWRTSFYLSCALFCLWSLPAYADDNTNATFSYLLVGAVAVLTVVALATVRASLSSSDKWSLADALSEEADVTVLDKDGKPIPGSDGKPQLVSELRASSSRFIALIGLIGILMIYLGFGLVILQGFASTGVFPDDVKIKDICWFLFAGVTMFAPYIVNKFSSVFDWLKPTK